MRSMRRIFKTEMLIYHSKANLDANILFGQITHHLDTEIRICWLGAVVGRRILHSIPELTCY